MDNPDINLDNNIQTPSLIILGNQSDEAHTLSLGTISLPLHHKVHLPFGSNLSPLNKCVDKMDLSNEEDDANSPLQAHKIYVCTQFDYRNCDGIYHTWAMSYPCHWKQKLKKH